MNIVSKILKKKNLKVTECDNNFAISSQNIALSITKAGASAKAFGVTMEELIGNTTAITTATRESGSVVGKIVAA